MAGNPIAAVKANLRPQLASRMPAKLTSVGLVPVHYSHPGDAYAGNELVWFHGADTAYSVHSLRAGRRRRMLTCRFDVVAQVLIEGTTNDYDPVDSPLHQQADARADLLIQIVDEYIADDEHLASAALIDVAYVESTRTEYGVHEHGAWARVVLRVAFDARIL